MSAIMVNLAAVRRAKSDGLTIEEARAEGIAAGVGAVSSEPSNPQRVCSGTARARMASLLATIGSGIAALDRRGLPYEQFEQRLEAQRGNVVEFQKLLPASKEAVVLSAADFERTKELMSGLEQLCRAVIEAVDGNRCTA